MHIVVVLKNSPPLETYADLVLVCHSLTIKFVCSCHTGASPLQTNGVGHTARAYAKEGEVSTLLQEWEGKV